MTLDARVLILSDGKMGDLVQCRGVAQALVLAENVSEFVVKPKGFWALPLPMMPVAPSEKHSNIFASPVADIVIASGRRTLPYIKAFGGMKDGPFTVFLKDPRHSHNKIDLIWAPNHDGLAGGNVLTTLTAPHTITNEVLAEYRPLARREISQDGNITGIILGGNSGQVTWSSQSASRLADQLRQLPDNVTPVVVSSRRTPDVLLNAVELAQPNAVWPERHGIAQPYLKTLAISRRLVVTGDSHNMVSEALATGAEVKVFTPPGLHPKLGRFLDELENQGYLTNSPVGSGELRQQTLNSTHIIAAEIERCFLLTRQ